MVLGHLGGYERRHRELLTGDRAGRVELLLARGASERCGDKGRRADDDAGAWDDRASGIRSQRRDPGPAIYTRLPLETSFHHSHPQIPGISYTEALVFLNHHEVGVVKSRGGQFSAPINLRNLPAGTDQVKITVITTAGSIISGTRTYHTCRKRLPFHGPPRL